MKYLIYIFLVATMFVSCGDSCDEQNEIDEQLIVDYLSNNSLTAVKSEGGVYVVINDEGTIEKPNLVSEVTICYTGYFLDGEVFETSYDDNSSCLNPASAQLLRFIEGWQEGIPFFGRDGRGTLLIPSCLAYGDAGAGDIQPNTVIAFDIYLVTFTE